MVTLPRRLYDELIEHAEEGAPAEVCGVLGGDLGAQHDAEGTEGGAAGDRTGGGEDGFTVGGAKRHVRTALRASNAAANTRTRYAIDPGEQLALMTRIEDDGDDVVGFYHSHPRGPARPSETDLEQATWPGRSYVIVSLEGDSPRLRSWRYTEGGFERELIVVR